MPIKAPVTTAITKKAFPIIIQPSLTKKGEIVIKIAEAIATDIAGVK